MVNAVLAENLFLALKARKKKIVFAESLTGGLISAELTKRVGASEIFWGSFVTYSVEAKKKILSVPAEIINDFGVVSVQTAEAMALGALKKSFTENDFPVYSAAVTGMASTAVNTTNTKEKMPSAGTVCIAVAELADNKLKTLSSEKTFDSFYIIKKSAVFLFEGDREAVRVKTVNEAFRMVLALLDI